MLPKKFRENLSKDIVELLRKSDLVAAAWETGSVATGRLDQYSDLDLNILSHDDDSLKIFSAIEGLLHKQFKIKHEYFVPIELSLKDVVQRFYFIEPCPEYFCLDICVFKNSAEDLCLDIERHGNPTILFDTSRRVVPEKLDQKKWSRKRDLRLSQIRKSFHLYKMTTLKEAKRGRIVDAFGFYVACLKQLNEALGMKYRPDRFDFGFRFTGFDYPLDIHVGLADLCYLKDIDDLNKKVEILSRLFEEIVSNL